MESTAYRTRSWRDLPRTQCVVERLFDAAAGPCTGTIHRHHVDERDPASRTIEVCQRHHPMLQAILRRLRKRALGGCPHRPGTHRYAHAKRECDRRHMLR